MQIQIFAVITNKLEPRQKRCPSIEYCNERYIGYFWLKSRRCKKLVKITF